MDLKIFMIGSVSIPAIIIFLGCWIVILYCGSIFERFLHKRGFKGIPGWTNSDVNWGDAGYSGDGSCGGDG